MQTLHFLHAELEELQNKYWHCFNDWHCDEDLEKLHCEIEELQYKLSIESSNVTKIDKGAAIPHGNNRLAI